MSSSAIQGLAEDLLARIEEARRLLQQPDLGVTSEVQLLRDLEIRTRKLVRAADKPPCLGFFGPSQAGKSFLVGALLSRELGTLEVICRDRRLDFLRDINPAKGVESTGVVTRFSVMPPPVQTRWADFLCQVMGLEETLESMATGFLVECTSPAIDGETIDRTLQEASLLRGTPADPPFRKAWDYVWHSLVKRYRDRHPFLNELRRHRALTSEEWKSRVTTIEGWRRVYSLLLGGPGYAPDLENLLRILIDGLTTLGFPQWIEARLEDVAASADGASLIDAACLNSCGTDRSRIGVFSLATAREVSIEPGVMAALIAEIRMPLAPRPGALLEHADLLDFPGGRALKGINGFGAEELSTGRLSNAIEVFKRGKLTYLFEQYSLDREITTLVLASPGPTKPEAVQMQTQVENWLRIRHGAPTPADPAELERPSLFIALTKFDMSLGALRSDNARDRWDSRVKEACVDFWARSHSSWINNWGGPGRPFTNMFWIRNPYADQMQALQPGTPDYEAVKRGYHESEAVRRYIADYGAKWLAVEGLDEQGRPKSGIPLLVERLREVLVERRKEQELAAEARTLHRELVTVLRPFTPSKDDAEREARALESANALIQSIERNMQRQCSGAPFSELIEALALPEAEIEREVREAWGRVAQLSVKASARVKRLLVHVLKWWIARAARRVAERDLGLPGASVDYFLRQVLTSKKLLPILGRSVYNEFLKHNVNYELVARILSVRILDAIVGLLEDRPLDPPEPPIRLTFGEVLDEGNEEEDEIDWTDMSFDDDDEADEVKPVELIFAGKRWWEHWKNHLSSFYLANESQGPLARRDPRVERLAAILQQVEALEFPAA